MPEIYTAPEKLPLLYAGGTSVFLAGGITGCGNWQQEIIPMLDVPVIVNPRRDNFPIDDPNAAREQITWEYEALRGVDMILFWFTDATVQPICLFELGGALERIDQSVHIGIQPGYVRELDVRIQAELAGHELEIVDTLEDLAAQVNAFAGYYNVFIR